MKLQKRMLSLASRVAGRFYYSARLKSAFRKMVRLPVNLEEHYATLIAANGKTRKWLVETGIEARSTLPAETLLVSIVMATWNRKDIIEEAIRSVLDQSYQKWELIIVDDGSTDGTRERVEKYTTDNRIRYVCQNHRGAGAARNAGLVIAQGEIITYLDTDVMWFPGYLSNVVTAFTEDVELNAVYTAQLVDDTERSVSYVRCEEFDYQKLCRENYIDLNVFAHRRSLYEREGGFDEKLDRLIDWDLIKRYSRDGKIRRLPLLGGIYTYGRSDQITRMNNLQRNRKLIEAKQKQTTRRPIRVLYALWHYPQLSESYVRTEIRGVSRMGIEVEVWSEEGVSAPFESDVPVNRGSLAEAIASFSPDIIHTHWLNIGERVRHHLKESGLPLTVRGHGFDFSSETVAVLDNDPAVKGIYLFPHQAVLCASPSGKVRAMPVAFDPDLYYPSEEKDRRLVMRTGCALPTKDYISFFRTAQICTGHHFMLALCYAYKKEDYLEELLRMNQEFGNQVEIKVNVQHEEMSELMRRAGIYLHTADPNEPFGMSISISEAMATGSYLLGRRLPATTSYINEAGKLYNTPEEAASLICETTKWIEQQWNQVFARSINRAYKNFTHVNVLKPLVDLWRDLSGRN